MWTQLAISDCNEDEHELPKAGDGDANSPFGDQRNLNQDDEVSLLNCQVQSSTWHTETTDLSACGSDPPRPTPSVVGSSAASPPRTSNDLDELVERLRRCELPTEGEVKSLCDKAREILLEEGNLQAVDSPVTVCGDIHGQFYDLKELFVAGKEIPDTNYLFLGDYVDRGYHSVETFLLLLALKTRYPDRLTLLRGNHECRHITEVYGFYDECWGKYGNSNVWKYCTDIFDCLGLAAVIDGVIFCVHGGLSPDINKLDEIRLIDRKREIPVEGAMCDLLWSDPNENDPGWDLNPRGAGFLYGSQIVKEFSEENDISLICRAHQLAMEGYKWDFDESLVTVWSAPNYCYRCGNVASVLEIAESSSMEFRIFTEAKEQRQLGLQGPYPDYFL